MAHDAGAGWITLRWDAPGTPHVAALNFAGAARDVPLAGLPAGRWRLVLATDAAEFAGAGAAPAGVDAAGDGADPATLAMPPHAGALYRLETE